MLFENKAMSLRKHIKAGTLKTPNGITREVCINIYEWGQ